MNSQIWKKRYDEIISQSLATVERRCFDADEILAAFRRSYQDDQDTQGEQVDTSDVAYLEGLYDCIETETLGTRRGH